MIDFGRDEVIVVIVFNAPNIATCNRYYAAECYMQVVLNLMRTSVVKVSWVWWKYMKYLNSRMN